MELSAALAQGRSLMNRHGLTDWTLTLDRAKTRAGACRYRSRQISLSAHLTRLHSEAEVRDTILHEIAHALVGAKHGHDEVWRATAQRIGSSGARCSSPDAPSVPGAWQGRCPNGHTVSRHRAPTRVGICTQCDGPEHERIFRWTHRGREVTMHPNYLAELSRIRVPAERRWPGRQVP